MKNICIILLLLCSLESLPAQKSVLTLDQAIALGLENNFSIRMLENQSAVAHNNNHPGRAGFLPNLSFNTGLNFSNNAINQSYANGLEVNRTGVASSNLNSSLALSWTLFDGFRMFVARDRLRQLDETAEMNLRAGAENLVMQIISLYGDLVRRTQVIHSMETSLQISRERLELAEQRQGLGAVSKAEVLQARVDLNAQRAALMKESRALEEVRMQMNVLLARDPLSEFVTQDSLPPISTGNLDAIEQNFHARNTQIRLLEKNIRLAELNLKDVHGQRMPLLSLNGSYAYSRSKNQAGFVLLNQNNGFNYGLSLSVPIFRGMNFSRDYRNAILGLENARLLERDSLNRMYGSLRVAWQQLEYDLQLLQLEEDNALIASENLTLAGERYRLGASDVLSLKDAQRSYEEAMIRVAAARYAQMLTALKLKKLEGALLKDEASEAQ